MPVGPDHHHVGDKIGQHHRHDSSLDSEERRKQGNGDERTAEASNSFHPEGERNDGENQDYFKQDSEPINRQEGFTFRVHSATLVTHQVSPRYPAPRQNLETR